eukprot:9301186-Pyramimonas_sp.AAC.1
MRAATWGLQVQSGAFKAAGMGTGATVVKYPQCRTPVCPPSDWHSNRPRRAQLDDAPSEQVPNSAQTLIHPIRRYIPYSRDPQA